MKEAWRMWALVAALGLVAGGAAGYYQQWKQNNGKAPQVNEEQVLQLSTDSFSLRLFQHALEAEAGGNVLVAPHILTETLLALQELAGGKTLEELQALQLSPEHHLRSSEPQSGILLGMDFSLPRGPRADYVMALPFSDNVPMALGLFNGTLAPVTGRAEAQLADSTMVTERTKLLAGYAASFRAEWQVPFYYADTRTADFDNASGGMPHFRQMRSRGAYRIATAEDNSWKAVSLPMQARSSGKVPLVLIAILPAGAARDFAEKLTPDQLTAIRRALAEASPEDTLVEFPRLELQVQPNNKRDSMRRLGLKALFDTETADFSQLTSEKIHLGALVEALNISLVESTQDSQPNENLDAAARYISFNRPFVWLLADLHTGTPIEFIGLVEEM